MRFFRNRYVYILEQIRILKKYSLRYQQTSMLMQLAVNRNVPTDAPRAHISLPIETQPAKPKHWLWRAAAGQQHQIHQWSDPREKNTPCETSPVFLEPQKTVRSTFDLLIGHGIPTDVHHPSSRCLRTQALFCCQVLCSLITPQDLKGAMCKHGHSTFTDLAIKGTLFCH